MRFLLHLTVDSNYRTLPINYYYEVSAWIYKKLASSDIDFSTWLHHMGYSRGNKRFKMFHFSNIDIADYKFNKDCLIIKSDTVHLQVSFYAKKSIDSFMEGLFLNEDIRISDGKNEARFSVAMIEQQQPTRFENNHVFKLDTPLCLSRDEGRKHATYLSPDIDGYENYFFNNLIFKYVAIRGGDFDTVKEELLSKNPMRLSILSKPHSRLIKLCATKSHPLKVRGYTYRFAIEAPSELIELGYYSGFGEKNSQGFGFAELICFRN